jgi:hypothetical protein
LKRAIWAVAQERGWIADDNTYPMLSDDFAEWCAQGEQPPIEIADAAAETLKGYLSYLKPARRMRRGGTR